MKYLPKLKTQSVRFILFVLLIGLVSCSDDDVLSNEDNDYILFGHFYGMCVGEYCVEIYKIEDGKLYEDTLDNYPSSASQYVGEYIELSHDLYQQVADIEEEIPNELYSISDIIIGCPDCADGGGVFIQVSNKGQVQYWMIDQFSGNIPGSLHSFIEQVNAKIALLQ